MAMVLSEASLCLALGFPTGVSAMDLDVVIDDITCDLIGHFGIFLYVLSLVRVGGRCQWFDEAEWADAVLLCHFSSNLEEMKSL